MALQKIEIYVMTHQLSFSTAQRSASSVHLNEENARSFNLTSLSSKFIQCSILNLQSQQTIVFLQKRTQHDHHVPNSILCVDAHVCKINSDVTLHCSANSYKRFVGFMERSVRTKKHVFLFVHSFFKRRPYYFITRCVIKSIQSSAFSLLFH